jgi:hypothetical protein
MRANTKLLGLIGTATLAMANVSAAQEQPAQPVTVPPPVATDAVAVPASTPVPASVPAIPARGATMEGVKAKFGAPSQEGQAVGTPPITRWEYPGYVVYFENDRVLHTVIAR